MRRIPSLSRVVGRFGSAVVVMTAWSSIAFGEIRVVDRRIVMGGSATIQVYAESEEAGHAATRAAFARMAAVEAALSDYRPKSESRILVEKIDEAVPVSADLAAAIGMSQRWHRQSGGAFDPTIGPLTALWRSARREGRRPAPASVRFASDAIGFEKLTFDPVARTVRCRTAAMQLDFGGIGKGMAADAAMEVLRSHGLTRVLIEVGGDLLAGDPPPGAAGWRVRVRTVEDDDSETILLANAAVATSGDVEQFLEIEDAGSTVRLSHLLDPRTGEPIAQRREVTVTIRGGASPGADADAMASCASVLGFRGAMRLADGTLDGEIRFFEVDDALEGGGRVRRIRLESSVDWAGVGAGKVLAEGFAFTEGPVVLPGGDLVFTDQPRNHVVRVDAAGRIAIEHESAKRANGLGILPDGRLVGCAEEDNQLLAWNEDGSVEPLAVRDGEPFNGPNDLWVAPDGAIWFTDPFYDRPWHEPSRTPIPAEVYRRAVDGSVKSVAGGFIRPNGIVGSRDGRTLWVADLDGGVTQAFEVTSSGDLKNRRPFFPLGSDGMSLGPAEEVILTGKGLFVLSSRGALIRVLLPDAPWVANACFGGPENRRLFVTTRDRVLMFQLPSESSH
ncbi:MAG: FAD:protein FMN transferase [Phycisphaerales bacterium]|nr:FAD:protein FMN transferase [Phycisphaerales bacterium]